MRKSVCIVGVRVRVRERSCKRRPHGKIDGMFFFPGFDKKRGVGLEAAVSSKPEISRLIHP